jgi:hypothetical protein
MSQQARWAWLRLLAVAMTEDEFGMSKDECTA